MTPPTVKNQQLKASAEGRIDACEYCRRSPAPDDANSVRSGRHHRRRMRNRAREVFVDAMRDAHYWLNELLTDPTSSVGSLAVRVGRSERSIRMTLSLAFLAPDLARAATEGRLPRGFGIKRLIDLPMLWPEQWRVLGLEAPTPPDFRLG